MPLDIVFENEVGQPNAHYMKAVIYDYEKKLITISQTSPALTRHFLNRKILVTFLEQYKNRTQRFGFSGLLFDLVGDYRISSGNIVEALKVKRLSEDQPIDFRMYFRVRPPSEIELRLLLMEQKVNLIDISIGGAKFTFPRSYLFRPGDTVKFKLIVGLAVYDLSASVRSVQEADKYAANRNIQYVSVEFRIEDQKMEVALGRAILDIERSLLSKGSA